MDELQVESLAFIDFIDRGQHLHMLIQQPAICMYAYGVAGEGPD